MKLLLEIFQRIKWMYQADRLGPDMLPTYICLFSPTLSRKICKKSLKNSVPFQRFDQVLLQLDVRKFLLVSMFLFDQVLI